MSMEKYYTPTEWENYPSEDTAINAMRLNHAEDGINELDDRIVELSTDKSEVDWNQILLSGEKIAEITINGIKKDVYTSNDSAKAEAQAYKAEGYATGEQNGIPVESGSPYYQNNAKYFKEQADADATTATEKASEASTSASSASSNALISEGYAVGKQNGTDVPSTSPYYHNNAKYYEEKARSFTPEGYQELVDDVDYYEQNGYLSKNIFDGILENGTIDGNGNNAPQANRYRSKNYVPVKPNTTYVFSHNGEALFINVRQYYANKSFNSTNVIPSGRAFTTTEDVYYIRFFADDTIDYDSGLQLEEGSTVTSYMPYAPSNNALNAKKADISAIGTDESGNTTASKAYAIGEHFYKDEKFCTAKTAIASGATFTLNTNYVEGDVATEITNKIVTDDFTISVGNVASGTAGAEITQSVAKTGYEAVGVVIREGSGSWWTVCNYLLLIKNNVLSVFANNFSPNNASSVSIKVRVTYAKI